MVLASLLALCTSCASPPVNAPTASTPVADLPEYNPALIRWPERPGTASVPGGDTLTVTTWNVEHLGRASFDLRGRRLLDDADVITFQEVDANVGGIEALRQIKLGIEARTGHPMCFAVSAPTDGREFYGFVWRDDRLAEVLKDGRVKWTCDKTADVIRLTRVNTERVKRPPALAVMIFKPNARPFVLASVHLVPTARRPAREVAPLFDAFDGFKVPVIVAGDFNLPPRTKFGRPNPFDHARTKGFWPSLIGVRTSLRANECDRTVAAECGYSREYDNLWTRGFELRGIGRVDLFREFPELDVKTIRDTISDHAPVTANFAFEPPGESP